MEAEGAELHTTDAEGNLEASTKRAQISVWKRTLLVPLGHQQRFHPSFSSSSLPANMQRTFVAVKPDGVQRGLCGEIIKRFEQRGFRLVAAKFMQVTMATAASAAVGATGHLCSLRARTRAHTGFSLWSGL